MLSEREKRFLEYWATHRDKEKKVFRQLLIGLPVGLLFAVPIIINLLSGWYKRADMWARGHTEDSTVTVLIVAVLLILVFVAIFARRHRWEMNEQTFRELLDREERDRQVETEQNPN